MWLSVLTKTCFENSLVSAHHCGLHSRERKKPLSGQDRVSSYYKVSHPPLRINVFIALYKLHLLPFLIISSPMFGRKLEKYRIV